MLAAKQRAPVGGLETQHLLSFGECGLDVLQKSCSTRRQHELLGLVFDDPLERSNIENPLGRNRPAEIALAAAGHDLERRLARKRSQHRILDLSLVSCCNDVPRRCHGAATSRQSETTCESENSTTSPNVGRSNRRSASAWRRFGWGAKSGQGFSQDEFGNSIKVRNDVEIPEAQYLIALQFQKGRSLKVVQSVLFLPVLRSIKLNNDLCAMAGEVGHIAAKGNLPSKVNAVLFGKT